MKKITPAMLEALLFLNGEALTYGTIQKVIGIKESELKSLAQELAQNLEQNDRGLVLVDTERHLRLGVKSEFAHIIEKIHKNELQTELSKASLEVLSLVSYLGPIARVEVDAIRGVNSSYTLRNLALRGLIDRKGNADDHRGYVYEMSPNFLSTLGIANAQKLPEYHKLRHNEKLLNFLNKENSTDKSSHEEA